MPSHTPLVDFCPHPSPASAAAAPSPASRRDFYYWSTGMQYPMPLQKVSTNYFIAQNPAEASGVTLRLLEGGANSSSCPPPPAAPALTAYALPAGQDSANMSASEWRCDGAVQMSFPAGPALCGTAFPQRGTWLPAYALPTLVWPDAAPSKLHTVIIVDRDAVNRRSPLLMAAFSNILGSTLLSGFNSTADLPGVVPWLPYIGPTPLVNSSCHRYYLVRWCLLKCPPCSVCPSPTVACRRPCRKRAPAPYLFQRPVHPPPPHLSSCTSRARR